MSKQCVKCGYVRQSSDTAPDYECPKCGVIYSKAEHAIRPPVETPDTPDREESDGASQMLLFAKKRKGYIAAVVIIVASLTGFFYVKAYKAEKVAQQAARIKQQQEAQRAQEQAIKVQEEARAKSQLLQRKMAAEREAKAALASVMKDPTSVQYRNVFVALDMRARVFSNDAPPEAVADYVCGEYNAKNGYGGYAGFKWFYWDSVKRELVMNTRGDDYFGDVEEKRAKSGCIAIQFESLSKS